jgi:hypothetical protein
VNNGPSFRLGHYWLAMPCGTDLSKQCYLHVRTQDETKKKKKSIFSLYAPEGV